MKKNIIFVVAKLWSGRKWTMGLFLWVAVWEIISVYSDPLIVPGPRASLYALWGLVASGALWPELKTTTFRALSGFGLAFFSGSVLGLLAGMFLTVSMLMRPVITILTGTPPIAWLVLALLWFGSGNGTPVFTAFIACLPVVFVSGMQGARTLDGNLKMVAGAFELPALMRLTDIYLPHMISYLIPGALTALGISWKVTVMAELLATVTGVGAALAVTRSHLDTAGTMAWILSTVIVLLSVEYLVFEPVKRRTERWRTLE
ncbi:MAG: ABC transporter permease [Candidatus Loosdrechtia sp.]|uniref:ABC transporter permease n=1 Tax=Candidatus Loosdrechtia sp. TaxID=3101272 RepID=UPI003A60AB7E|nr:MAG: ABC transporter permease subunit [Candidatus Jettenia sp. AMX2]